MWWRWWREEVMLAFTRKLETKEDDGESTLSLSLFLPSLLP